MLYWSFCVHVSWRCHSERGGVGRVARDAVLSGVRSESLHRVHVQGDCFHGRGRRASQRYHWEDERAGWVIRCHVRSDTFSNNPYVLLCLELCLVPSSVLDVSYQNISSTSILVAWVPPLYPNGRITHYTVYGLNLKSNQALKWMTNSTSILITGQVIVFAAQVIPSEYKPVKCGWTLL